MATTIETYPQAPYSYNDPRICYNEPCFLYNGGFDLVCLAIPEPVQIRRGGGRSGARPRTTYPTASMIDFTFRSHIDYVNDEKFEEDKYSEVKKFRFPKNSDTDIRVKNLKVKRKVIRIHSNDLSVKTIQKHLSASSGRLSGKKTSVSSALTEFKLKEYVSSSLRINTPKKIKVLGSIIRIRKDKKK